MCRCQTDCENHFNVISGSLAYDRVGLSLPPGLASPPSPIPRNPLSFSCLCVCVPGCVCGVGVGYSDFFLLHRQGLFFGFRILNFINFGGLDKKWLFWGALAICRYFWGVTFKIEYFLGGLSKFSVFFGSIVRIGVRTCCWTDSCFNLVLTDLFLLCFSSLPLK